MAFIEWNDDLAVGIESIDTQHKRLIELINELHEAMRKGQGRGSIGEVVEALAEYTKVHFSFEEKLMRTHGWSEVAGHLVKHGEFVRQVREFQSKVDNPQSSLVIDTMTFLRSWLVEHIKGEDRRYAPHLRSCGAK